MTAAVVGITSGLKGTDRILVGCPKCDGSGRLSTVVDAGRCWPCGGTGQVSILVSSYRARARRLAKRTEAEAARTAGFNDRHTGAIEALRRVGFADIDDDLADPKVTYLAQEILFLVRDHGWTPASAFAEWQTRYAEQFNPKPRNPFRNRRPGPCKGCTVQVEASAGWLFSLIIPGVGDSWHLLCERCSTPYLPEA